MPASPSRRTVLHGLVGLTAYPLISACTSDGDDDGSPGAGSAPDPDLALIGEARATTEALLAGYEATVTRHAPLADRLKPMRDNHAAHLAALEGFRPDLPASTSGPDASAAPSASAAPGVPAARDQAVEALAAAELAAAGKRVGQCRAARAPQLARLLAAIGGSEAAHTAVLRGEQ